MTVKVIGEEAAAHHEKGGSGQGKDQHRVVGRVRRRELSVLTSGGGTPGK